MTAQKQRELRGCTCAKNKRAQPLGYGQSLMSIGGYRNEELDTDLCKVEVCFQDHSIGQGDAELLFDPALMLGYRPAQHVWSRGEFIYDGGRASPIPPLLWARAISGSYVNM